MSTPLPPLDGRDISRIRTEVRLAQLALSGLVAEEEIEGEEPTTPRRVLALLVDAEGRLEGAVGVLGEALAALNKDA